MDDDKIKVKSLKKALEILNCFEEKQPLGVTELSERMGLYKSNVHNILSTFEATGYVEKDKDTGKYYLGMGVIRLARSVEDRFSFHAVARPLMQQLADRTNETVYITVPMGRCVYYLDAAYPGTSSTLFVGSIRYATGYMHATSSGKAMLASMPEEALKEYLRHPLEKSTDMTITEPEQLAAEIEEVRRRGYATDNMEMDVGINCVGVAIRDRKGDVVGALSVSGPSPRFYEERLHQIADMLKATVREIECKI